jgi:PAS domain S-box-containing protein
MSTKTQPPSIDPAHSAAVAGAGRALQPAPALRQLRKLLAVAVIVIGCVMLLALSLVALRLDSVPMQAQIVNLVGRQRFLALRVVLSVEKLADARTASPQLERELSESLASLAETHAHLRKHAGDLGANVRLTPEMAVRLERSNGPLRVLQAVGREALRQPRAGDGALTAQLDELRAAGQAWIEEMDALTELLVIQRMSHDAWSVRLPWMLGLLILIAIAISWGLLYEPALKLMAATMLELEHERALRDRLDLVARSTTNSVIILNREAQVEWINEAATRLTGYSLDELRGKRPSALLSGPETDEVGLTRMQEAITNGRGFREHFANYAKDGRKYWGVIDCQPLLDSSGRVSGFVVVQSEITAMLELERKLTKQAERHDVAMKAASMGVWEWDVQSGALEFDEHQAALFGVDRSAPGAVDPDWRTRIVPEDRSQVEESLQRALRGEGNYAAQFRVRRGDGELRWLRGTGVVIPDAAGRPARLVGVNMDVTVHVSAEEQRREIDLRLRTLAANLSGVVYQLRLRADQTLCFPYASDGVRKLFGVAAEDVLEDASRALDAIHTKDRARFDESLRDSARTLGAWAQEFRVVADGKERWLSGNATPIRQADGSTVWYGVMLDSSILKEAERREREAAASLEEAQALARMGSWSYDLRTGALDWSRQMYALCGRDPSLGAPDLAAAVSLYSDEDAAWIAAAIQRAVETAEPYSRMLRVRHPQNGIAMLHADGKVNVDPAGKPFRMFGTLIDMTAAVAREEALQRAHTLAEAGNRAKSEFLANMSHEIRTPMAAILGYVDLLVDPELAPAQLREYTTTVQRNARHLLELLNQVLDLSKIEAGQIQMECIACSPAAISRELVSFMRPRAEEKQVALSLHFDGSLPAEIQSDPTRLRQILINLIGNAIKFTEHGSVELTVALDQTRQPAQLKLQVRDTGIGIEPSKIAALFQPFSQADSSTTRRFGGTGLGLSIANHLARLLGGEIEVSSTLDVGSVFTARIATGSLDGIPMIDCSSEVGDHPYRSSSFAPSEPLTAALAGLRVLLVEDGVDNQRLISLHLTRAGAIVEVLANGRLAVDRLISASSPVVDAVLMDMQMPVLDGYAATTQLRSLGYTGAVIALTAHAMPGDRQKCLEAGCDDYAAKPIDIKTLIASILAHAPRRNVSAPARAQASRESNRAAIISTYHDDPEMADLIDQFAGSLPDRIAELDRALTGRDFAMLGRLAHQLKGAGGGYGFAQITSAAQQVENDIAAGADEAAGAAGDSLTASMAELASVCRAVRPARVARS